MLMRDKVQSSYYLVVRPGVFADSFVCRPCGETPGQSNIPTSNYKIFHSYQLLVNVCASALIKPCTAVRVPCKIRHPFPLTSYWIVVHVIQFLCHEFMAITGLAVKAFFKYPVNLFFFCLPLFYGTMQLVQQWFGTDRVQPVNNFVG